MCVWTMAGRRFLRSRNNCQKVRMSFKGSTLRRSVGIEMMSSPSVESKVRMSPSSGPSWPCTSVVWKPAESRRLDSLIAWIEGPPIFKRVMILRMRIGADLCFCCVMWRTRLQAHGPIELFGMQAEGGRFRLGCRL